MLGNLRDRGKAVILSTHQMNEVEELCDHILMLNNGSAVLYGNLKEIKSRYRNHSVLVDIEGELGEVPGVMEKRPHKGFVELVLDRDTTPQQVLEKLFNRGIIVNRFEMTTPSLNEIFLKIVSKKNE
jgi:ABC-2 type transport system ATP-binding protein